MPADNCAPTYIIHNLKAINVFFFFFFFLVRHMVFCSIVYTYDL